MNSEQITSPASLGGNNKDHLLTNLKHIVSDTDDLLKGVARSTAEELTAMRSRIETSLGEAKVKLEDAQEVIKAKAANASAATDKYVRNRPWQAVGVAAVAGLVTGFLIRRR